MHNKDIVALLAEIAGLGTLVSDATFAGYVNTVAGGHGPLILGILGLAAIAASRILRYTALPASTPVVTVAAPVIAAVPPAAVAAVTAATDVMATYLPQTTGTETHE